MVPIKPLLSTCRAALIISLITLALCEIVFRAYHVVHPLPIFYSDSYNRFRPAAFAADYDFRLNSRGFKTPEFSVRKAEGTFRILGLGDSFAFGVVPYADNYLTLLERELKQHGQPVELINMGIPGTGPQDYLALLVREGLELSPDMVMVSFFIGNDFDGRTRSLLSYSYALSFFKYAADRFSKFEDRTAVHKTRSYDDNGPTFTDDTYLQIERIRSSIYLDGSNRLKRGLAAALGHLREMKAICDSRGIRLMVVLIPDELQLGGPLQDKVIANAGLRRDELDFARPSKLLAASLNSENIDHLDLLDAFAAAAMRERLYKPNDSHWNIRGNQLAMRVIYDRLSAQLALPGD